MDAQIAELHAAIDVHALNDHDEGDWPVKDTQMLSRERVDAFERGDHGVLDRMDGTLVNDFNPIYSTIEEHGNEAFAAINDKHGKPISFCGNKDAMVWVRVTEDQEAKDRAPAHEKDKFVYKPTVEVGTFSKTAGKSVWTTSWWKENIADMTVTFLAAGIGAVVGRAILGTLTKRASLAMEIASAGAARAEAQAAVDAARRAGNKEGLDAAIKALREARKLVSKVWMKNLPKGVWVSRILGAAVKFPRIASFLGGGIVTIAFQLIFEYGILPVIRKDYYIKLEICNFDTTHDWKIDDDWYHDNGIIAGGSAFESKVIPRSENTVETPWGPVAGEFINVSSVTIYFQNSFEIMDGVGIAVKAQRDDSRAGCAMGYLCSYWKSNQLTVKDGFPKSSSAFYWDDKLWPKDRPLKVQDNIKTPEGDLPLQGSTNALNGVGDHIYKFYVGIGKR